MKESNTPETDGILRNPNTSTERKLLELSRLSHNVERERNKLRAIIAKFCQEENWSASIWKTQSHIKPLFDIAAKFKQ